MIVSVQHITKYFAGTKALDDVSFEIPEGSIYGLLGPNGAGKTTCIRILNQMIRPVAGEITIDGKQLRESDVERIGYLPEERGLYKKMRVAEQILYFASLKNMDKNHAKQELEFWLEKLEIGSWRNKRIEELSKGMQQKVQFIATVLHKPSLLILDEPFSGFDPVNAQAIKNEVIRLKNEGTTILLSTHNMNSVEELCDRISLIHKSKQILNGAVGDIRNSFAGNTYEVAFSGYCDTLSTTLTPSLKILGKQVDGNLTKLQIELMPQVSTNDAIQFLMKSGSIVSFQQILPSMNDIFIQAVEQHNKSEHGENV